MATEQTIPALKRLIVCCEESRQGLRAAAETVAHAELQALLHAYAQQRGRCATALKAEVRRQGEHLDPAAHRPDGAQLAWSDLEAALTDGDARAILAGCEHGVASEIKTYVEVLGLGLPADVAVLVNRQYTALQRIYDQLRVLRQDERMLV